MATPNCNGCHEGDAYQGELALVPSTTLMPGEQAEFTLRITEQDMQVAGYFVTSTQGVWAAGSGNRVSGDGVTHSQPAAASSGVAEVSFFWTPPAEPGGGDIGVYVVASNNDRTQLGDKPAAAIFSYVWGCEGVDLFEDIDGDGYGNDTGAWSLGCETREGFSTVAGDCNDLWASIYPGAPETADGRDENCDGEVDDGIVITTWYVDEDQDGFGYGAGVESDVAPQGYVGNRGDCDDEDAEISPVAVEVCDGRDNDCNQQLDDGEGVFVACGLGLCGRRLEVCDRECIPGTPQVEMCNGLDDDCDGESDEGVTCPEGMECIEYTCVVPQANVTPGSLEAGIDGSADNTASSESVAVPSGSASELVPPSANAASQPALADAGSPMTPMPRADANSTKARDSASGAGSGCAVTSRPRENEGRGTGLFAAMGLAFIARRGWLHGQGGGGFTLAPSRRRRTPHCPS